MITNDMVTQLVGRQAYDRDGKKIGQVGQVYVDDNNGSPVWATVNTGLFGMKESFVPLGSAAMTDEDLKLAVSKDEVKDAPHVDDSNDHISAAEETKLSRYYSRWMGEPRAAAQDVAGERAARTDGDRDAARQHATADRDHDGSMVRSEERLRVGTESVETGQVRVRKYVVTEDQQVTVPVRHEEVRLEREPIGAGDRVAGGTIGEEDVAVTLHAERPVVEKQVEAVERVRLGTETVTEQQTVSDTVRKEVVDVDDPKNHLRGGEHDEKTGR